MVASFFARISWAEEMDLRATVSSDAVEGDVIATETTM